MVLNRRIGDTNAEESKSSTYQRLMETSTTTGRRWNLSDVSTHRESIIGVTSTSGQQQKLPTFYEPTTHQKVHRILTEHKSKSRSRERNSKSSSSVCDLPNYVVASKGNLSPGFFALRESCSKNCSTLSGKEKKCSESPLANSRANDFVRTGKVHKSSSNNWERKGESDKSSSRPKSGKHITKSSSVPINLKEGLGTGPPDKTSNDKTLKKSSFEKIVENKSEVNSTSTKKKSNSSNSRPNRPVINFKKSSSRHTLNSESVVKPNTKTSSIDWCEARKKVSFSSDTSFTEKKISKKSTAIHESKIYHKGVLRDISSTNPKKRSFKSASGETMSQTLLRAARDADEFALNDIISRIRRCNLSSIDVNITDSSGRSAISYMAGNGSADVLEIVLSYSNANPNLPDNEGNTPLHFAAQAGQAECLNILLQKSSGIELDARNVLGFTPLMKAALQGRTKCAKILLFAGANPTLRDHGRGFRAEQWARFCGRHVCAEVIERFTRHKLIEKSSCRWGSEPELATKVLQGKIIPVPLNQPSAASSGLKSRIKRVFRNPHSDKSFSLVSQLTNAALCASSPVLPKPGDVSSAKDVIRPLNVPQLRITLVASMDILEKCEVNYSEPETAKPSRVKKKNT
ncbi:protein HOS4-like [Chelonus insularis]|uniref:protein HOS4-like n=1 Tax=Chelonus insularis TaxID=460826 RepID=UPI00158D2141|nr:protein HOS4-like [Chelonus insularis]